MKTISIQDFYDQLKLTSNNIQENQCLINLPAVNIERIGNHKMDSELTSSFDFSFYSPLILKSFNQKFI